MKRKLFGYLLVALAACSWGTWPVTLHGMHTSAAMQSAAVMAVMTFASLPVVFFDRVRVRASPRQWAGVVWLGVSDAMNLVLFFAAYRLTTVAIAVLTHYLTPLLVAIGAPFFLSEKPRARTFGAVVLSSAGLVLLLEPWRAAGGAVGALCGAGSAVFYASNVLVNKRLAPVFSAAELMFFHGLVATPLLFAIAGTHSIELQDLKWLAIGALGPGMLAGLMFVWGLRRVPASHASVLTLLEPLVAVVLGASFLQEPLGKTSFFGAATILAGALVVISPSRGARRRGGIE